MRIRLFDQCFVGLKLCELWTDWSRVSLLHSSLHLFCSVCILPLRLSYVMYTNILVRLMLAAFCAVLSGATTEWHLHYKLELNLRLSRLRSLVRSSLYLIYLLSITFMEHPVELIHWKDHNMLLRSVWTIIIGIVWMTLNLRKWIAVVLWIAVFCAAIFKKDLQQLTNCQSKTFYGYSESHALT